MAATGKDAGPRVAASAADDPSSDGRGERQDVRLAVALTGGVSLAVWMGGVATEIQHLVRGHGTYGALARLTRTRVAVDVVGGSSAGGINGACLALSLSHGSNMAALRDLWVEQGSLELLVRPEGDTDAASLLRGDGYFLPHIRAALTSLCRTPSDPSDNPVELVVTGTLLRGRRQQCSDDFGSAFTDVAHRAQFRFRRGSAHPVDDFARPDIAARLALAARCTSSFPGAFEASWCPVGADDGDDRPDMADHVDFPHSSWVIDGGVLVNKPLGPVLTTLASQPDEPDARRVVLFVQPAPDDGGAATVTTEEVTPGFAAVLGSSFLAIPHAESLGQELALFEQHNAAVRQRGRRGQRLLSADVGWLRQAATQLLEGYLQVKADAAVSSVIEHLPAGTRRATGTLAALNRLRDEIAADHQAQQLPTDGAALSRWRWTTSEVAEAERVLAEVLGLADALTAGRGERAAALAPARESLQAARRRLHHQQRREAVTGWRYAQELLCGKHPSRAGDTERLRAECAQLHAELTDTLVTVAPVLRELAEKAEKEESADSDLSPHARSLGRLTCPEGPLAPAADPVTVRSWLLHLAVVLTGEQCSQQTNLTPWELLHVSAEAPNAFDARVHPADKLAGLQLQHFGAFHKSSWRANDWLWGRLDTAARLVQMQLSPRRLRYLALADPSFVDDLAAAIGDLARGANLEPAWQMNAEQVAIELAALRERDSELPSALPACTAAVLAPVQAQILREELPYVAARVTADERDGHTPLPGGHALVEQAQRLTEAGTGEALVAAFTACRLGEERIADDARSVVYRRTVDRVAAVAIRLGHPVGPQHHGPALLRLRLWSSNPLVRAVHRSAMQSRVLLLAVAGLVVIGGMLLLAAPSREAGLVVASVVGCACLALAVTLAGLRVGHGGELVTVVAGLALAGGVVLGAAHTGPLAWRLWLLAMAATALAGAAHIRLRLWPGRRPRPDATSAPTATRRRSQLPGDQLDGAEHTLPARG